MANHNGGLEEFLDFTSAPAWRSAIFFAAVSFSVCHIVAVSTPPLLLDASGNAPEVGPQLLHMAAVLLRFVMPLACLLAGVRVFFRRRRQVC